MGCRRVPAPPAKRMPRTTDPPTERARRGMRMSSGPRSLSRHPSQGPHPARAAACDCANPTPPRPVQRRQLRSRLTSGDRSRGWGSARARAFVRGNGRERPAGPENTLAPRRTWMTAGRLPGRWEASSREDAEGEIEVEMFLGDGRPTELPGRPRASQFADPFASGGIRQKLSHGRRQGRWVALGRHDAR